LNLIASTFLLPSIINPSWYFFVILESLPSLSLGNLRVQSGKGFLSVTNDLESENPTLSQGVAFAVKHGGRALIGDEMGLGKTIQAMILNPKP
jgi:SNF2 family DNA or RNA helicase